MNSPSYSSFLFISSKCIFVVSTNFPSILFPKSGYINDLSKYGNVWVYSLLFVLKDYKNDSSNLFLYIFVNKSSIELQFSYYILEISIRINISFTLNFKDVLL